MSYVRRFDHVGVTVADLDVVTGFFVALGLEVEGRTFVEGEFLDTVCGIPDARTEIVMLKPPGDGSRPELSSFVRPDSVITITARATPRPRELTRCGCRDAGALSLRCPRSWSGRRGGCRVRRGSASGSRGTRARR
jgi:catechol 2,3-dioxygenase-like lactoylglutathione lyase family enzyme